MEKEVFDKAVILNAEIDKLEVLWWMLFQCNLDKNDKIAIVTKDGEIKGSCKPTNDITTQLLKFIKELKNQKTKEFENL